MTKITIKEIIKKKNKTPITCLTAYTKNIAEIVNKYCDIILVGDSLGMVLYGMKSTKTVNLNMMLLHGKAVKKSANRSLVVFDMPYKTYTNKFVAYKNAKKIMKFTKCDAIKLEGGKKIINIIKHLTQKGIPVMGHIGLLPQSSTSFKVKGKAVSQKKIIFDDAIQLYKAGVFSIIIECVVEDLAKKITKSIPIPTIGIGASKYCDGQILVINDMLGLSGFYPKFVKQYANLKKIIGNSVKRYVDDVKNNRFPNIKNRYK